MRCPRCGCENLTKEVYTLTNTDNKNYDVGSGICGAILFGWPGLLCGLFDSGSKTTTTTKIGYRCNDCGANLYS